MKKIILAAAAAVMSMSSAAYASDILGNASVSSLSSSEMAAIQGEGGGFTATIIQASSQTNTNTGGTAQQATQSIQQIGISNVAVNSLTQEQTITTTTITNPAPTTPNKPKVVKKEWKLKW